MKVIVSILAEAKVDRTLMAAQRQGGAGGMKPSELLHQVPEIGGAGIEESRRGFPGSPGAAPGLGNGVRVVSVGAMVGDGGRGGGAAVGVVGVELGAPLIAGDRHVCK